MAAVSASQFCVDNIDIDTNASGQALDQSDQSLPVRFSGSSIVEGGHAEYAT
jgi:hypothetical protein